MQLNLAGCWQSHKTGFHPINAFKRQHMRNRRYLVRILGVASASAIWPFQMSLQSQGNTSMAKSKETIRPPTKRELSDASPQMRKGHPSGGRTMADASVAKKQRVKPRGK
jgi:hypothetical protein